MKDKRTDIGKMARNSHKIAILLLLFVLIQTIHMGKAMLGKVYLISYSLLYHDFSKCSNEN